MRNWSEEFAYHPGLTIEEMHKRHVELALEYFEGNKTSVSNALGITIKTLYNWLHRYGLYSKYVPKEAQNGQDSQGRDDTETHIHASGIPVGQQKIWS